VHFTTTPAEKAYAAAVQKVVESYEKKNNTSQQDETDSYVEQLAKDEENVQPYFDKYREEYVTEEAGSYRVVLPVEEILEEEVVREYTYEILVKEENGTFTVVSMEKTEE
jgi:hypothetical protein